MKQPPIVTHEGTVTATRKGMVSVQIKSVSACAACQAHSHCGFTDSQDKTLDIPTPDWQHYAPGQTVSVQVSQQRGLLAAWIAYVMPAILMLAIAIGLSLAGVGEGLTIAATLATLALYTLVLYTLRNRLNRKFTLSITHELKNS